MGKKKLKKYCIAIFHKKICFTVQINTAYVRIRDIFQNHLKNRNYSTLLRAKALVPDATVALLYELRAHRPCVKSSCRM